MANDTRPSVFLALPHYGQGHVGSVLAATLGGGRRKARVACVVDQGISLLPMNFNTLLDRAIKARNEGLVTHFAMVHSDVQARAGWLDILAGELEETGANLISAVIPIKSDEGLTSTAIGTVEDPWSYRYVHLEDRANLPATFGPDDVCDDDEVLLVNTGLWLCDLRDPFWDTACFRFVTRTGFDADGRRVSEIRPEDWELSRDMDAAGLQYRATWKVDIVHHGNHGYRNRI